MARVRMFAALREAAGRDSDEINAASVQELLAEARRRYGEKFAHALQFAAIAVNGERLPGPDADASLGPEDEVALLPPVSGGG